MTKIGVAAFVKTPGFSSLKTRLAAGIGKDPAAEFYAHAVRSIEQVLMASAETKGPVTLVPHWAVAEDEAVSRWNSLPVIRQGTGDLGERLDRVYQELRQRFSGAVLIGADSPQLSAQVLMEAAAQAWRTGGFALGPAGDGGFYLLAGVPAVPCERWQSIPYSVSETARTLCEEFAPLGHVSRLGERTDVDTRDDLPRLRAEFAELSQLRPAQNALVQWLDEMI